MNFTTVSESKLTVDVITIKTIPACRVRVLSFYDAEYILIKIINRTMLSQALDWVIYVRYADRVT